jgi:lauroyl/myristoyl acyltransferase
LRGTLRDCADRRRLRMPSAEQHWGVPRGRQALVTLKDLAWLVYLYPARWLAGHLPLAAHYVLWDALARLGAACLRGPRRKLALRLRLAFPDPADRERNERIAADFFRKAIARFGDDLVLPRLAHEGGLRNATLVHRERLAAALACGKGALLVSGHFMASRAARQHLAAIGYPAASVRNLAPADFSAGRLGAQLLQRRYVAFLSDVIGDEISVTDPDCSLTMMARLRAGGLLDVHVDAAFSKALVRREFLGVIYPFGSGAFHLAWMVGAPVVPMRCLGDTRGLSIEFGEPIHPERWQDRAAFAEAALDRVLAIVEQQIRAAPAEWDLWVRW